MTGSELAEAIVAERRRNRRIARLCEISVIVLVAAAAAAVFLFYHPENAGARRGPIAHIAFYNHVSVCQSTLRGYSSDDDIHNFGVAIGATSFGGWGAAGHYADNSVWINAKFNLSSGPVWAVGRCYGGDYNSDWFTG